jgi:hypothetical protein
LIPAASGVKTVVLDGTTTAPAASALRQRLGVSLD